MKNAGLQEQMLSKHAAFASTQTSRESHGCISGIFNPKNTKQLHARANVPSPYFCFKILTKYKNTHDKCCLLRSKRLGMRRRHPDTLLQDHDIHCLKSMPRPSLWAEDKLVLLSFELEDVVRVCDFGQPAEEVKRIDSNLRSETHRYSRCT